MKFVARCVRAGDDWAIEIPDVDEHGSIWTQAHRLDQVEAMAREAIALTLDVDEDDIELVEVEAELPDHPDLAEEFARLREIREEVASLQRQLSLGTRQAVVDLRSSDLDLPMRDVGWFVGLSHQRVAQILEDVGEDELASR